MHCVALHVHCRSLLEDHSSIHQTIRIDFSYIALFLKRLIIIDSVCMEFNSFLSNAIS